MIFITGYRTSDCTNAAAARCKQMFNAMILLEWSVGMVAVSYLLLISFKLNSRAEQSRGHPRQCEYPRHREQLILSQARCGDVTCSCHVSRVTQWVAVVPAWHWSLHHTSRYYVCVMNTIVQAMMDEAQQQDHRRQTFAFHEKQK